MQFRLLVADDEKNIREGLAASLEMDGYQVETAAEGDAAFKRFQKGDIDLVITDLRMPGLSGEELLKRIDSETPGIPVIVLTGHGTVENAVAAMRNGAYDFLTKPVDLNHLSLLVKRALQNRELILKHRRLEEELEHRNLLKSMIGDSAPMRQVFDTISRAAPSKASILITGESGVGKELVADAIHELSPRKGKPLVKVHCAALSASIMESELFGHEKGSFTGAVSRTRGRFELANEGTLFLDEIGEIDQNIQIKLLRVLQDKKFERVGGEETIETDVRIVAATNKDLKAEIEKGAFREDLYFRLNVVNIEVPPLRERKGDLPLLITAFLNEFAGENGKTLEGIDDKARAALYAYDWPGNVRELRNCIESAVVMTRGPVITTGDLPPTVRTQNDAGWIRIPLGTSLEEAERIIIRDTLSAQKGNKSKAAEVLAIGRKTLHRKLADWGEGEDEE
ncbi:acetoacetate metabolism regulatory protein AtoC (Ornithine/argininedecarboxylase inhibitor) (Ornithine decarboxylase antizyme) [Treponema primitia ZAS-2]|uniref:Acetoacetate metabolism regulatory protein AtoC (Ornithine/argininedecarboxylase inhibitor) (Ornithine decarboxylase antizyme) n=1 Tax=Treponema primitia (strain ATCC BAA-887 / DSM 12427 / ZAS-2) TaxID=545694 RepID=F5YIH4_TREPZ|nr:sigma-54 dependent transcriptional regulator [Treponema primitia]AEF84051.1 acetoacetate metabolism regulatory protein AtoC (Ornithine/argininedecarboxylase inhibitor) (Ornithine decarboxylase antizyme) [Treponema primitia ZAS-2]